MQFDLLQILLSVDYNSSIRIKHYFKHSNTKAKTMRSHKASKVESGVYDYRQCRIVKYQMPDSSDVYWAVYKKSDGVGNSPFLGFDDSDLGYSFSLSQAKDLIDFHSKD